MESGRIIERTSEVMVSERTDDPARLRRPLGVIDLPTIQRYLNFPFECYC